MQNDIHAPGTTVYEALEFSAQMRIMGVDKNKLKDFVDQVGFTSHMQAFWIPVNPMHLAAAN